MPHATVRPPVSTRHAFALAFDLALRRDPLHSVVVPFLLRAPWIVAGALLVPEEGAGLPLTIGLLAIAAAVGDLVVMLVVGAMLRFRARSVFNTPAGTRPEPVGASYAKGMRRLPWLFVTEMIRNVPLTLGSAMAAIPLALVGQVGLDPGGLAEAALRLLASGAIMALVAWVGFKLTLATEAVVLDQPNTLEAFRASYRLTPGRFERWFEMLVVSVLLALCAAFVAALVAVALPGPTVNTWFEVVRLLVTAITPVIQFAWTFFYLRLAELDAPGIEVGPTYARADTPAPAGGGGGGWEGQPGGPEPGDQVPPSRPDDPVA